MMMSQNLSEPGLKAASVGSGGVASSSDDSGGV